jgi:hypothetical protein
MLIAAVICTALLAGCQSTPEEPIVVQKDMEQMIGMAQASAQGADARSLREQLNVPDTLTAELTSAGGKLNVHVDADVVVPDVMGIPTVRVGMGAFTQDDVTRLYAALCGDAMPVDPENTETTQAVKMRIIEGLLEQKETGNLDKYESMEELEAAIQQVMQEAAGLPEHFERVEPDFSFQPLGDGGSEVHLRAAPDDATISDLRILNAAEGIGYSRVEYYRDLYDYAVLSTLVVGGGYAFVETESPYYEPPSMDEAAARKLAQDTIAAFGLTDFVCSGQRMNALYHPTADAEDAPRRGVYEYMFTRQIGDVPVTYTNDDGTSAKTISGEKETAVYAMPWMYEKVRVIIDGGGILCFLWNSPYVVTDTVTGATAMLSFDEIRNTFEKMIPVVNNIYDTSDQGLTCDMYVTEVRLGLMRITEENVGTSGLLIPVWDFMGYTEDSNGQVNGRDGYNALLTINAINGSIIDRGLGY